ncbi:imidazole glycerol phosphate synthase subunit HisH [Haloferula sp. A504]|uniref:imidazole glycerol phosphate synthase subunit HisH n=1 Tax=Haloferula sp. A504 TaxID=3373601 RepID=UPI0031C65395|nr:imidazole glycerol phosphate synthase subunit HisH [Verrucomicrobiaceae bacterium E54]
MKTGIIDYGAGNLRSVDNAVHSLGVEPRIIDNPDGFGDLTHLILPGVGAFGDSMAELERRGLVEPIRDWIAADRPFFGICVGYQMLFEEGDENPGIPGLGIFKGRVVRFPEDGRKIPHMGWNAATARDPDDPLWDGLGDQPFFYFVHSYFPEPADDSLTAMETDYEGLRFASAIRRGKLLATQFHPEKSQQAGLRLLRNFLQ